LALKDFYAQLSKLADKYLKSILVSHQGIDKWMHEDTHEIELSEMPKNFDYYAMGHIHNYIEEDFGKGKLVYPGSMEIWRTSENNDNYREYGKGFVVVDLSYDTPEIERVKIDLPREFYNEIIDYNKFEERLPIIKKEIESLENKPMLDLTVVGGDFESSEVYEIIKETLGDSVLNLRPSFKPDKVLTEEESINPDNILDPRTLLHMKVNDKYGKDAGNLSINLLDNLSIGRVDDAKIISDRYYSEHYHAVEENDSDSNQDKIKESEEIKESDSLDDYLEKNLNAADEEINDEDSSKSKQMSFDDF
jgi:DNA repair exonuclease SbcCD nuclease subunit